MKGKHRIRTFLLDNEYCEICGEQLRKTKLGNKWCNKCYEIKDDKNGRV